MEPHISIIVARAKDQGIGCSDGLPWRIPEELKYFKNQTKNKPVIMGRKTFESIINEFGAPLEQRTNIVVSRSERNYKDAISCLSLEEAIEEAKRVAIETNANELFVIGGSELFKQALPLAERVYLTRIDGETTGKKGAFKKANAWLKDEWIPTHLKPVSSETKFLEEKFTERQVECIFEVLEKTELPRAS